MLSVSKMLHARRRDKLERRIRKELHTNGLMINLFEGAGNWSSQDLAELGSLFPENVVFMELSSPDGTDVIGFSVGVNMRESWKGFVMMNLALLEDANLDPECAARVNGVKAQVEKDYNIALPSIDEVIAMFPVQENR